MAVHIRTPDPNLILRQGYARRFIGFRSEGSEVINKSLVRVYHHIRNLPRMLYLQVLKFLKEEVGRVKGLLGIACDVCKKSLLDLMKLQRPSSHSTCLDKPICNEGNLAHHSKYNDGWFINEPFLLKYSRKFVSVTFSISCNR